jgi:hypothetical protein
MVFELLAWFPKKELAVYNGLCDVGRPVRLIVTLVDKQGSYELSWKIPQGTDFRTVGFIPATKGAKKAAQSVKQVRLEVLHPQ